MPTVEVSVAGLNQISQHLIDIQRSLSSLFQSIQTVVITTPPGGSPGDVQFNNAGVFGGLSNVQVTARILPFSSTLSGAAPASGGGTTNFLRADGTWAAPAGTTYSAGTGLTLAGTTFSLTSPVTAAHGGTGATGLDASTSVSGGNFRVTPLAQSQATPANPTGTTDTTGKMMGLAGALTPAVTGKVLLIVSGTIFNAGGIADGAKVQIRHGTGSAPANGDALTGTAHGGLVQFISSTTAEKVPFSLNAFVTGLAVSTAIWIDVGLAAITGGTATISDVSISAVELE